MSFDGNLYGIPVQNESVRDKIKISESVTFSTTGTTLVDVTGLAVSMTRLQDEIFEVFLQPDGINVGFIHTNSVSTAFPRALIAILRNGVNVYETQLGVANPGTTAQLDVVLGCVRFIDVNPNQGINTYQVQITNAANDSVTINCAVLVVRKID
jgi:hypothetical protein